MSEHCRKGMSDQHKARSVQCVRWAADLLLAVSKEILSQRTADSWVEALARNHHTPIAWAEKACARKTMSFPGNVE